MENKNMMIKFDLTRFLFEKRLNQTELGKILNVSQKTISAASIRGTVSPKFLRLLESKFGNLDEYITDIKERTVL